MKTPANLHAEQWKSGTEALAFCMICGGENPPSARECPDCHVSLSLVRRCPGCQKIVSAQHKKCVYCRTPFVEDAPKPLPENLPGPSGQTQNVRRMRAAVVSVGTFVVVFFLGMFFLRMIQKPALTNQVIAKAQMLRSAPARRTPSFNSSHLGKTKSGAQVGITGYQESDQGRWMTLDWSEKLAYVPLADVSAPRPINTEGASALKFYISGIEAAEPARDALSAVEEYAKAFPGDARIDELKYAVAERMRTLALRGGSHSAELRDKSHQLFEQLAAGNGAFASEARTALQRATPAVRPAPRSKAATRKKETLQIIGGAGTRTSSAPSPPHEVTIH